MDQKKRGAKPNSEEIIRSELASKFTDDGERKLAVIVGASSGIGYETAIKLIGRNYRVVNISRTPCRWEAVANCKADVSAEGELENAVKTVGDTMKFIDVLIYCAGFSMASPIEKVQSKDIRYLFEVNYFGALRAMQSALPYMKEKGGRIILVSSMGSVLPIAFDSFYSSSKSALNMLAKSASTELSGFDIHTTAVLPGGTSTTFTFKRKVYSDDDCGEYFSRVHQAVSSLAEIEQNGMSAGEVAKIIVDSIEDKNPPVLIYCGAMNKMYAAAQKILPEKASLYLNNRKYFS